MNPAVIVEEVLRFEDLPVGSMASRRVVVRWSDGTEGEALRWFGDEILVCEGDVIGKTRGQLHLSRGFVQYREPCRLPGPLASN